MKKIRGKIHYFGRWARWYMVACSASKATAGKRRWKPTRFKRTICTPGEHVDSHLTALPVADLCNSFLTSKLRKVEADEMGQRTFTDYKEIPIWSCPTSNHGPISRTWLRRWPSPSPPNPNHP